MSAAAHPQDLRAAELALGVLEGEPLAEARALAQSDRGFAAAVEDWELRLAALAEMIAPVAAPERVWLAIRDRLAPAATVRWWDSVDVWRGLTAASAAIAAVGLGLWIAPRSEPEAPPPAVAASPYVALVSVPDGGPALAAVTVDAEMQRIVVTPVALTEQQAKSLELWVVPADGGAPRSLGLVKAGGPTVIAGVSAPTDGALAISLEPEGGSPTGAPTGPILGVGPLTKG
jgi:anti-sigma-K factor RskA